MAEAVDNGKMTVDLVWSPRPKKDIWQRQGRGPKVKVAHSLIPKILRDIGPEHPIDFNVAWKAEKDKDAPEDNKVKEATAGGKLALARAANSIQIEEREYSTDSQRIQNKTNEGIAALIGIRKQINTSRGALRLLLEILKLSIAQNDRASAYDLLWAIESCDAFKTYEQELVGVEEKEERKDSGGINFSTLLQSCHSITLALYKGDGDAEERYKALVKEAKGMKQAQLAKECEKRGLSTKGSKDDLLVRLRDTFKKESEAPAIQVTNEAAKSDKKPKKGEKEKPEKDIKGKDSKGGKAVPPPPPKPSSVEGLFIAEFYDKIQLVQKWRAEEPDMIKKQLTDMSHLLPPLSPFTSSFKLDDWQKRVLQLITDEKSVLICAPTSSGKTVLSSYVASSGRVARVVEAVSRRPPVDEEDDEGSGDDEPIGPSGNSVLFIVPSDPLVWQVGAHFAKWTGLDRNVALITDRLSYAPHLEQNKPAAVVVGTPLAVENALTKIRGKSGSYLEEVGKPDGSQLIGGYDNYKWVVYDEVHSLGADTPDGLALQRLIKALKCNFLALSATVGNAEELRSWMEKVRGEQINAECVNVTSESEVKMEIHEGRFINLQRHVWTDIAAGSKKFDGSIASSDELDLIPLHPLSAVSLDFLKEGGFSKSSLPMTPQDSFSLWTTMTQCYELALISDLDPHTFFSTTERITLSNTKAYETHMKTGLEKLAKSHPEQTQRLLSAFTVSDLPPKFSLYDLVQRLRVKDSAGNDKLPCIVFHLDIVHLIGRFKELLYGLEAKQREAYPTYYETLEGRRKVSAAEKESALKSCATEEEKEELMKESESLGTVDTEQPHPDFVLNQRCPISRQEFEEICKDVSDNDFRRDLVKCKNHPLMRALRRGVGLYIDEVAFQAYKRAVMKLATKGKLAVVFSDESLAFGVNMPFRTCVFCGDMGGRLNTLLVQQMSGRAGRRGLDTQGHLVYAGAKADFVRNMVISRIPAVKGSDPRYLTLFLQHMCSQFSNPPGFSHQMDVLGQTPLCEFSEPKEAFNMNEISRNLMLELRLIEECDKTTGDALDMFDYTVASYEKYESSPSGYKPRSPYNAAVMWMIWDMRDRLAESIICAKMLPLLWNDFAGRQKKTANSESEDVQFEFIASLLHIIDRRPAIPDQFVLSENQFITSTTVVKRQELRDRIVVIEAELLKHNQLIKDLEASGRFPTVSKLLIPCTEEGQQLDGTLLHCFITGTTDEIPFARRHQIKQQLWELGNFLRSMHNTLWPDKGKYGKLEVLTRKCFMRIQYIAGDHIKNSINFTNVSAYELEGEDVGQISAEIESLITSSLHV